MTQPFLGQIQPYGFGFAPKNWATCNGQILTVQQNTALFSLLGTYYGGNGTTNFALPNLQSRVPVHAGTFAGTSYLQGEDGGAEQVLINLNTMPAHTHAFMGSTAEANSGRTADNSVLATVKSGSGAPNFYYAPDTTPQPLNNGSLSMVGANQPHTNIQPYLAINWCICLNGYFPARN